MAEPRVFPLIIQIEAEREARDGFLWYHDRDPRVAARFEVALESALATIAEAPFGPPEIEPGVRRILLARFPYAVLYAVEGGRVVVLAVAHTRRQPGYWRAR